MKIIRPISEKKRSELENELVFQKNRLKEATSRSAEKFYWDLSAINWIQSYPLRSAAILVASGFVIGSRFSGTRFSSTRKPL